MAFTMLRYILTKLNIRGVFIFIMNGYWVLSNAFSVSIEMAIWFFYSINMMCHIDWFAYVKPSLHQSVRQFSRSVMSDSLRPQGLQHPRPPCLSPTPGACSNSYPSSRWCHLATSSSVIPLSSHFQSSPASGSFPMSQFFTLGDQSIGVSTSASVLPMSIQDWFPLGWTGWVFLQSKGLSRVFSNTTVQKHQFFGAQLSLESNFHIHTWLLEKNSFY